MVKLDPEKFLGELGQLYSANRKENRRAVWLTIKRTYPKLEGLRGAKRKAALRSDGEGTDVVACLIRASNGRKKIATEIGAETAPQFSGALMNVVRLNADDVREKGPAAKRRKVQDAAAVDGSAAAADATAGKIPREASKSSSSGRESAQHPQQKPKRQQPKAAAAAAQQQQRGAARRQQDRGDKRELPAVAEADGK